MRGSRSTAPLAGDGKRARDRCLRAMMAASVANSTIHGSKLTGNSANSGL
jgi:hypothetical protein